MFARRSPKPLLVTTEATTRVKRMTPPTGPALPMGEHVTGAAAATEDTVRAIRQSALVIGFLASGAAPTLLTDGIFRALTEVEGCGLPTSGSRAHFSSDWCDTPAARRRLVATLARHQPAPDPTGTLTRLTVATWLRTSGYAASPELLIADR
ncbi:MAG: hypothetical protein MUF21_03195 [Gemmatimonadaceae bacterium]|jgi:hypothetical protein|nr:hypothetical protein [Gemmatimonadaceae bacterium]